MEVFDQGVRRGFADAEAVGKALVDGWLKVEAFPARLAKSAAEISEGENISLADAESLLLARKYKADFLVDDKVVLHLAKMYGLKVWSTWTLLLESQSRNLITATEIGAAIEELGKKKFRLNAKQVAEILQAAKLIEKKEGVHNGKTNT